MKIEMNPESAIAFVTLVVAVVVITCTAIGANNSLERTKAAFKAGLEEIPDSASSTHYGHGK